MMGSGLIETARAQAQGWSPDVVQYVRDRQEQEYFQLADALGLDSANAAYDKATTRRTPPVPGPLPTRWEDPYMYPILAKADDMLRREMEFVHLPAPPKAFLATLPSGEVEARTIKEPATKTPIVFFEQGLFPYFYDVARLMAWAAPILTEEQLTDDEALAKVPRRVQMPFNASRFLGATFYAYAVTKSPVASSAPMAPPIENEFLAIQLTSHMERFALTHELMHIRANDGDKPQTPQLEYDADLIAGELVSNLAYHNHGSWAVGYWGAELVIVALDLLCRAIGFFQYGFDKLKWVSETHPEPSARRERLLGVGYSPRAPKAGVDASLAVSGMTQALFNQLWAICLPGFAEAYRGGARTSPRWRKTAQRWQKA